MPDDDEVAGGVRGHVRIHLGTRRVRVDAELRTEDRAGAGVALAEDAIERAVLSAMPDDDKVARGVRGHGRISLTARRVRVDAELMTAGRLDAAVPMSEDAEG